MSLVNFKTHCSLDICQCTLKNDDIVYLCKECNELFHEHCYQCHCYVDHSACFNCDENIYTDDDGNENEEFIKCEHCGANIPKW